MGKSVDAAGPSLFAHPAVSRMCALSSDMDSMAKQAMYGSHAAAACYPSK